MTPKTWVVMNSTQKRLSNAAWAMLEALSRLRKSVQQEQGFYWSISPTLKSERLEAALDQIDGFSSQVSGFLAELYQRSDDELESAFSALEQQYGHVEAAISDMLGH